MMMMTMVIPQDTFKSQTFVPSLSLTRRLFLSWFLFLVAGVDLFSIIDLCMYDNRSLSFTVLLRHDLLLLAYYFSVIYTTLLTPVKPYL